MSTMRKRLIIGLAVLNGLFAFGAFAAPAQANQLFQFFGVRDCCVGETCCFGCCWFVQECSQNSDCDDL